jgi:predicted Zn-dependent protease with MMP-like domain
MEQVADWEFNEIIAKALDELPGQYTNNLSNVAIVIADQPTAEQRQALQLRCDQSLFGLYEGIALLKRTNNYSLVLPDKITLFKNPLAQNSTDMIDFAAQVKRTLWHEIAHYYGLDHNQIHALEAGGSES